MEVCPSAGVIATEIADRIAKYHGFALIADYGHTGEKTDTFRVTPSQNYYLLVMDRYLIYTVSQKKLGHFYFYCNFGKCGPISIILSLLDS